MLVRGMDTLRHHVASQEHDGIINRINLLTWTRICTMLSFRLFYVSDPLPAMLPHHLNLINILSFHNCFTI